MPVWNTYCSGNVKNSTPNDTHYAEYRRLELSVMTICSVRVCVPNDTFSVYLCLWLYSRSCALTTLQFLNPIKSVGLLGRGISPSQSRYLPTEQQKHKINEHTYIHASSGIRTHDHSVRAGEDGLCLRPRDHCDRQCHFHGRNILLRVEIQSVDANNIALY
jgi:hypothetical protein